MSLFHYQEKKGYFSRLKEALSETKDDLSHQIQQAVGRGESRVTDQQLDDLEEVLIGSDIGVETTVSIVEKIRQETRGKRFVTSFEAKRVLREELLNILQSTQQVTPSTGSPHVILVVGVNGVGKTTTIGKLAHRLTQEGKKVLISASDTFRAAAVEQLEIWADRVGCDLVKQGSGADPAAVLYDALAAAGARGHDVLIVDTAGRLHNKNNLMMELEKMARVASREVPGAPHESLLILDATTGQNGLIQARQFVSVAHANGIVITKLDGTAKGGIVVAIAKDLGLPIHFVGVGEGIDDLIPFSPQRFVDSLLSGDPSQV